MEIFKHNFFRTPLFLVAIAIMTIFLILGVLFSLGDVSKVLADENNLASSVYDGVSPEGPIMNPSPIPCTGGEDAALIQDNVPWFAPTDQDPLGANITELKAQNIDFCVINSSEVGTVNLSQFPEIIISAAQVQSFYNNIFTGGTAHSALTNYVQNGGILSANLTDNASGPGAGGNWDGRTFIGGLTHVHNSLNDNAISAPNHPIITGQFGGTNGGLVVDTGQFQDLDGWNSSSHGFFTNLPPNTTNIIVDSLNRPIMIEYSFGSGKVIASQVTNEWRYVGNFGGLPQNKKLLANEIGYQRSLAGPEDEVLDVRYFDQADSRWAIEEYDTASEWIPSVVNTTISRWGCMLSSVAMVLQYHGITTLPNCTSNMCTDLEGLEVNPSNLNQWLLREPGGYYSGFVNLYTAIDKLSDFADKPLIYEKFNGWDEEVLEDEIKNERPAIIELGDPGIGHFAV
ncbi:MAG: hypothetical protein Q8P37_01275, partial [Candidatus Spechtbacteria bacterium]|nr:hypothetical protein [Candidatus Spechtbacteria bacterium]